MKNPDDLRASSCLFTGLRVIAIMVGMIGCGGAIAPSSGDGDPAKGVSSCPTSRELESGAAVGGACAQEGTYCADLQCDPCVRACAAVSCSGGHWSPAVDTAICTGDRDAGPVDTVGSADAGPDAVTCTRIDPSGFDRSCTEDPDCVAVSVGNVCNTGSYLCAAGAINVSEKARYQDMLSQLLATVEPSNSSSSGCSCPFFGNARCIDNVCRTCGGAAPACPDGG